MTEAKTRTASKAAKPVARGRWRWLWRIGGIALLLALLVLGGTAARIAATPAPANPPPGDAALVLGAAAWGKSPSPVLRERINHAIHLFETGKVQRIILTGGFQKPAEAVVGMRYAVSRGVDRKAILVEERSSTTEENLAFGGAMAKRHGLRNLLIVSDPYHMPRAMSIAEALDLRAEPAPTPTSMYRSWRTKAPFLARETAGYLWFKARWASGTWDPDEPPNKA